MEILAILNPISGNRNSELVKRVVSEKLTARNVNFEIVETTEELTATEIARDAVNRGIETIICIGGDGTIRQIVNAIAGTDCCLGLIPNGTGNLLATALGIPYDISKDIEIILDGKTVKMDLGKVNDTYFTIVSGCGFDAEIMKNVRSEQKKIFGLAAYYLEGIKQAFFPKRAVFKLTIDGKKMQFKALNVLFVNSAQLFGNFLCIVPNSSVYDGLLDIAIFKPKTVFDIITVGLKIFTGRTCQSCKSDTRIVNLQGKEISLSCRPKLMVQADGDILCYPPVKIEICPGMLNIKVPEKIDTFMMNPEEFFRTLMRKIVEM